MGCGCQDCRSGTRYHKMPLSTSQYPVNKQSQWEGLCYPMVPHPAEQLPVQVKYAAGDSRVGGR